MHKKIFISGIIFLFVFSSVSPIVFCSNVRISNEKLTLSCLDGGLMDSAWPMFHHDIRHTGRSPFGKSGNWYRVKWKADIGSMVFSSPAIDKNGTVYIGSNDRYFYAINSNGTLKWKYQTSGGVGSSPAIADDGTIYVGSHDGYLYAFYSNGTKKWSLGIGDSWVESSPVIDDDGTIYVASVNGCNICAVYPNGTKKWNYKTNNLVYSSSVLDGNGTVYCGSHDGYMYAIFTINGTLKWRYNTGDWCGGTGATISDEGIIYFGKVGGDLYALYPNGTLKWRLPLGINLVSSPALAEDGSIYVADYKPGWGYYFYSISPEGTVNWQFESDAEAMSASPIIDKYGIIYVGDWDGDFYAFNPDGTIRWRYQTLDEIFSSAAIGEDGTIFFGAHDTSQPEFNAYLYAIEPIDDNPPEKPTISGQIYGTPGTEYTYTAVTSDPDSDNVSYYFDWGDGTNSGWTEYVSSGVSVSQSHSWDKKGKYTVKVKTKDVYNMESDWETFEITIPRIRTTNSNFFIQFLKNHPNIFLLLRYLQKS